MNLPPDESPQEIWFNECVQPHEQMLRAWLRSGAIAESEVDDLVQECLVRVVRARERGPVSSPKAYLFATARNLLIDRRRKSARRSEFSMADLDELRVFDEGASVSAAVSRSEELELLTRAVQSLPERCRQVITLRKIYGMSQKEVALELGISENTVESQGAIGMSKLMAYFARVERTSSKRPIST